MVEGEAVEDGGRGQLRLGLEVGGEVGEGDRVGSTLELKLQDKSAQLAGDTHWTTEDIAQTSLTLFKSSTNFVVPTTGIRSTKGSFVSAVVPNDMSSSPVSLKASTTNAASNTVNGDTGLLPSRMANCSRAWRVSSDTATEWTALTMRGGSGRT